MYSSALEVDRQRSAAAGTALSRCHITRAVAITNADESSSPSVAVSLCSPRSLRWKPVNLGASRAADVAPLPRSVSRTPFARSQSARDRLLASRGRRRNLGAASRRQSRPAREKPAESPLPEDDRVAIPRPHRARLYLLGRSPNGRLEARPVPRGHRASHRDPQEIAYSDSSFSRPMPTVRLARFRPFNADVRGDFFFFLCASPRLMYRRRRAYPDAASPSSANHRTQSATNALHFYALLRRTDGGSRRASVSYRTARTGPDQRPRIVLLAAVFLRLFVCAEYINRVAHYSIILLRVIRG